MAGRRVPQEPPSGSVLELTVGPHIWRVVSDPALDIYLADAGHLGETVPEQATIRIRSDLSPSVWRETLLHEILHAAWSLSSLPETMGDREEEVVRALSPLLAQAVEISGVV